MKDNLVPLSNHLNRFKKKPKVTLDMTLKEVKAILGEPDEIEKGDWYVTFHYEEYEPYRKREIRFIDNPLSPFVKGE